MNDLKVSKAGRRTATGKRAADVDRWWEGGSDDSRTNIPGL